MRVGIVQNLKEFSENTGNLNLKNKREGVNFNILTQH
jgi:hypothetical protein